MELIDNRMREIAVLVAVASILQGLESAILGPFLRVGLANTMTLLALLLFGLKEAVIVATLRSILGAIMIGTFLTPSFFLSLFGAGSSAIVMGLFYRGPFGVVGVSILGAITNNLVKLSLFSIFMVKHIGAFLYLPILIVVSVIGGTLNGMIVLRLFSYLRAKVKGNE